MQKMTLTFSRQNSFKSCRKKHWFEYEMGIRREHDAKALRFGTNGHYALELLKHGRPLEDAIESIRDAYAELPEMYDPQEWDYERETLERLICAYVWRWEGDDLEYIGNEQAFRLPLLNPASGRQSDIWEMAGKIDGIVRMNDGRIAVMDHKFLSEDLSSDSPLWKRLKVDHQISLYVIAARKLGHDVSSVIYDVIRKPTIKPSDVPLVDEHGFKIVLDTDGLRVFNANNKTPRQTGDKDKGYFLQTRPMTSDEWGDKLTADITERPDWYFCRREIARLDHDLAEFESELWDIQKTIRDAQVNDRWYRTCNKDTCSWCSVFDLCTSGWKPEYPLPEGYKRIDDLHPELKSTVSVSLPLTNERGAYAAGITTTVAASEETATTTAATGESSFAEPVAAT